MTEHSLPGRLGRYEIIRELGRGGMGIVYEGRDPNIDRRVAIKTLRNDLVVKPDVAAALVARFLREGRAVGALAHPNIVTLYDADEHDGIAYIVMEFIEGGNLEDAIKSGIQFGVDQIVDHGAIIAEALAVLHDAGIIHRDIKPANILTPTKGPIKLADFGIAHVNGATITQPGAMIGTPPYMSPEQFMGQRVDGRSDLFSLGVVLYELVTGDKPFNGAGNAVIMHKVINVSPVPPRDLNFAVPERLNDAILKLLSKRAEDRYADGRVLAAVLRESIKADSVEALLRRESPDIAKPTPRTPEPNAGHLKPPGVISGDDRTLLRTAPMIAPGNGLVWEETWVPVDGVELD